MSIERLIPFKAEYAGKPLHELPDGASGYKSRTSEEALNEMVDGGVVITEASDFMAGVPSMFGFPDTCNTTEFMKILNQMQKGACAGFTMAQIAAINFWIATGGETKQFSGDAMYVLAQEKDGIKVVPLDSYGPTVKTYRELRPVTEEHRKAAEPYKLHTIVRLRSFDQMWKFQTAGLGAIQVCSLWKEHFMAKTIKTFFGAKHNSQHGGGHSWTVGGFNKAMRALLGINSWDEAVHDEGAFLALEQFWHELFQDKMSFVLGYSNMKLQASTPPGPRKIPYKSSSWG